MTIPKDLDIELHKAFYALSNREQDIIKRRFGLTYYKCYTLKEIAAIYHLSIERIRQIEKRALEKLEPITEHLKEYLVDH